MKWVAKNYFQLSCKGFEKQLMWIALVFHFLAILAVRKPPYFVPSGFFGYLRNSSKYWDSIENIFFITVFLKNTCWIHFLTMFTPWNEFNFLDALPNILKTFFEFGLMGIRKSTQKAVLGIGHRIIGLTSKKCFSTLDTSRGLPFIPHTVFIFRIWGRFPLLLKRSLHNNAKYKWKQNTSI